jgi:hypothetical protein
MIKICGDQFHGTPLNIEEKHKSFAYHCVREAVAARTLRMAKVASKQNLADLLTKPLGGHHFKFMVQMIL